jgi:hypothetical protein
MEGEISKLETVKTTKVNARCNGLKVVKNTLPINQYKILLNDSNGHG